MNILILGNGFDIAHGLKTKYIDFLQYCIEKNAKRIIPIVNYSTTFIDNIWLRHFITTCNSYGKNWIDLEEEINRVVLSLNKTTINLSNGEIEQIFPLMFWIKKDVPYFDFNKINDNLEYCRYKYETGDAKYVLVEKNDFSHLYFYIENQTGFINFIYDQLRNFVELFEKYLNEQIMANLNKESDFLLSLQSIGVKKGDNNIYILSFNYTNTCEVLYKNKFNTHCNIDKIHPIYVHGKINKTNNSKCNLVLGTSGFNNIPVIYNLFKKHNQRHKYKTVEQYQELLKLIAKSKTTPFFHIIGHSLDKSDHNILKHILLSNKESIINVYYHDDESQERYINNITDIIGEEEVMSKVRFIHQHDDERSILKPKN